MKKTIIQCVTAIICVVAIAITGSAAVSTLSQATITAAEKQAEAIKNSSSGTVASGDANAVSGDVAPVDNGTEVAPADGTATDGTATTDAAATGDTTTPAATGDTKSAVPTAKADIIKYYNTAMNKVISSKAGYTKKRTTTLGQLEGAEAIMKIQVAADAVNGFLGVGDTTYTNKKGEAKYLSAAALTEADVKSATCTPNGSVYTITLTLNDGKSTANDSGKVDNSPIKRSGLLVGADDKSDYDYKSAVNIYTTLKVTEETDITAVEETTSKTTITIKVDSTTGKITSFTSSWHWDASLTKVKYLVISLDGIGHADTKVSISNFQW